MDDLRLGRDLVVPAHELIWRFSRSSGPGGQSVNTTDSRVELSFDLAATSALPPHLKARAMARLGNRLIDGVITIDASEHRSQLRNRASAARRLVDVLDAAIAPAAAPRRATRPSRAAVERRLAAKQRQGRIKKLRGKAMDD